MISMTAPSAMSSKAISAAVPVITTSSRRSPPAPRPWERRRVTRPERDEISGSHRDKASSTKETAMTATGIGAAVRRKEDQRFITGKGHYTDDINRPGQTYAYFLRSPHAHAKLKAIEADTAAAMPGVLAVLTGAELAADKIGGLICG